MKLHAKIRCCHGNTKHKVGELQADGTIITEDMPVATLVEIVDEGSGVYLYRYDVDGNCVGDTWHLTIDEAKSQAGFEYGIADGDWEAI